MLESMKIKGIRFNTVKDSKPLVVELKVGENGITRIDRTMIFETNPTYIVSFDDGDKLVVHDVKNVMYEPYLQQESTL